MRFKIKLPVAVWLAAMAAAAWVAFFNTEIVSDITMFLPKAAGEREKIIISELRGGPASRMILFGVEGAPEETLAQVSHDFADAIRKSGLFAHVENGERNMTRADMDFFMTNRYLLSPNVSSERFGAESLKISLGERLREIGSPAGAIIKPFLPRDPTGELTGMVQSMAPAFEPVIKNGVWFSQNGKTAILSAVTKAPGMDTAAQGANIEAINNAFGAASAGTQAKLSMSGPPVFSVESENIIRNEMWRLSIPDLLFFTLLIFAVYRSIAMFALTALPLFTGSTIAMALVSITYGSIHGVTIAFGMTLIGVALDYPIHLLSHITGKSSPEHAVSEIWPTLRLGVFTTSLGYVAMLFSGFAGLAQLALFSIAGLCFAATFTRYVMPELIPEGFSFVPSHKVRAILSSLFASAPKLKNPLFATTALCAVFIAISNGKMWDDDLSKFNPVSEKSRKTDMTLRAELGAPEVAQIAVVTARSPEEALELSENAGKALDKLAADGIIGGYESAARLLPSAKTQSERASSIPEENVLRANVEKAAAGFDFRDGLFEPFVKEAAAAKHQKPVTLDSIKGLSIEAAVTSMLHTIEGEWVSVMPLNGVKNEGAAAAAMDNNPSGGVHYINIKKDADGMITAYRKEALFLLMAGALAIAITLAMALRSTKPLAKVVISIGSSIIIIAAGLMFFGESMSLFHLVSMMLVAGVGLDYTLFFNRNFASSQERESTILAVTVCNVTTVFAFGVLAFSGVFVLKAIGTTVATGTALSLLFGAALAKSDDVEAASGS